MTISLFWNRHFAFPTLFSSSSCLHVVSSFLRFFEDHLSLSLSLSLSFDSPSLFLNTFSTTQKESHFNSWTKMIQKTIYPSLIFYGLSVSRKESVTKKHLKSKVKTKSSCCRDIFAVVASCFSWEGLFSFRHHYNRWMKGKGCLRIRVFFVLLRIFSSASALQSTKAKKEKYKNLQK
jgi:hypothetical protein